MKFFFFKSLEKGVGSGSISQMYESADSDRHQNVTDPQHCCAVEEYSTLYCAANSIKKQVTKRCYLRLPDYRWDSLCIHRIFSAPHCAM
jgi:hypothetical protein